MVLSTAVACLGSSAAVSMPGANEKGVKNLERDALRSQVIKLFKASRGPAGTLMQEMRREGHKIGRYKVRALMREAGLECRQRRPHRYRSSGAEALIAEKPAEAKLQSFDDQ